MDRNEPKRDFILSSIEHISQLENYTVGGTTIPTSLCSVKLPKSITYTRCSSLYSVHFNIRIPLFSSAQIKGISKLQMGHQTSAQDQQQLIKLLALLKLHDPFRCLAQDALVELLILILNQA